MATTANIQIHISTTGDVVLDQIYNLKENPSSIASVITQPVGGNPGGGVIIMNPFVGNPGFILGGLLVVPPRDNIHSWFMAFGPTGGAVHYHPAAPSWFSWKDMPIQPEIAHNGPPELMLPFTFIWI